MTVFRTNFWELLSEKEQRDSERYTNISEIARSVGTSRVTFYKYADEPMTSVDASVIAGFLKFLELGVNDLHRFLVIDHSPQLSAQEAPASGKFNSSMA